MNTHKNFPLLLVLLLGAACTTAQKPAKLDIVPDPVEYSVSSGFYTLNANTTIAYPAGQPDFELAAQYLAASLNPATGFQLVAKATSSKAPAKNSIFFEYNPKEVNNKEGYELEVNGSAVFITAASGAGAFYAVQTLRQLLPPEIFAAQPQKGISWNIPKCEITDYPRFGYRGLHLDVSRHWFPVPFVKRYIDLLAAHKMNRFHWHLTDDQGWRIEIKKYPKLQQVAACRINTLVGHYSDEPRKFDNVPYCHTYKQEEVTEIVEYARRRFVTVVPEIEMPGHAMAALAAYPTLGCEGASYSAANYWGVFDDVFCAGNEEVFTFFENVMAEVCPLFPGEYIHVGGDECPKTRWKTCPKCQKRMKTEGLKDEHELQSYFIKRAEKILGKYNKKLIGWDEILEGGISPNATIMSWRGVEGGIAAARAGHDAIMTPGSHCYFDYYQSDPDQEPLAIGGLLTLDKVYSYKPIPAELTPQQAKHILGVQGNVWSEYIASPDYLEYMAYPRACALAEVAWSPTTTRNWDAFRRRLTRHFARLDAQKVNYAKSFFDIKTSFDNGVVTLECGDPTAQIRFTTDGSTPTSGSTVYTKPFKLDKTSTIKAGAWRGPTPLGKFSTVNYLIHKASGKSYDLERKPDKFTGGDTYGLTNGVLGGRKTWGNWVGLVNRNIDPVIDLGATITVNRVTTHYMDNKQAWIHPPKRIEVFVSLDGKSFTSVGHKDIVATKDMSLDIKTVAISPINKKARYIKFVATTTGVIPDGFPGANEGAWLFIDEVMVE